MNIKAQWLETKSQQDQDAPAGGFPLLNLTKSFDEYRKNCKPLEEMKKGALR